MITLPLCFVECHFVAISPEECPSNFRDIMACSKDMNHTQICEADSELPNGNRDININNCMKSDNDTCSPNCEYDVFKCVIGNCFNVQ